jgi:hypothetical protein
MSRDTVFDIASLTKLFTGVIAATLLDESTLTYLPKTTAPLNLSLGALYLDAPVALYIPCFAANGKGESYIPIAPPYQALT